MREVFSKFHKKNRVPRSVTKSCEGPSISYTRPSIEELKKICLDAGSSIADFDRAIKNLDPHGLIKTGTLFGAPASSGVWSAPVMNGNDYASLKEEGYKQDQRVEHSSAERKAAIEPSFRGSIPQHREPHDDGALPAKAVEVASTRLEAGRALAGSEGADSRRMKALQLVQFNMNRLQSQMSSSCRLLNDLRALHRLLLEERALAEEFHQA